MTLAELIEELKKFPQELPVKTYYDNQDTFEDVEEVALYSKLPRAKYEVKKYFNQMDFVSL
jgi:hypothetical protein